MTVKRVKRVSYGLKWGVTAIMAGAPLLLIWLILSGAFTAHAIADAHPNLRVETVMGVGQIVGYILLEVLLLTVALYVLWQLRGLFGRYAAGEILTAESAAHLLRAGAGTLLLAAGSVVVGTIQTLLLTWGNAPGERSLAVSVSNAELGFVISGGLLLVVGWALVEAARQAEENRGFV
ncbi:DUF2975 domain-containing protein [Jannaschia marina]|uniref:DUF2975 domain-containing protein n=1 Tax=Jannaschia marina TaxID=2741674 RepID=UPI0015C7FE17|nr:DUF2975 domain-containing protein [Jannaschia marina]